MKDRREYKMSVLGTHHLPPDKVELPHDMKNDNKSYKTNAHDKNNVRRNLEPRGVVCVKLQHAPRGTSSSPTTCCSSSPKAGSSCSLSSSGSCSILNPLLKKNAAQLNLQRQKKTSGPGVGASFLEENTLIPP